MVTDGNAPEGRVVREEVDPARRDDLDPARRKTLLGVVEHLLHNLLLALARRDERDAVRVIQDGVGERDARGGRLGRVVEPGDPAVHLVQQRVAREERAGVAIGAVPRSFRQQGVSRERSE